MGIVHVRLEQNHMATTFDLVVSCPAHSARAAERALERCLSRVASLEAELSEFRESSPVARLNHAPPGVAVRVPSSVIELLERSRRIALQTDGAFDCLAKSAPLKDGDRTRRLGWDAEQGLAWRTDSGARLGFGAIGKGYALDQVRGILESEGFRDYLLSAGGSSIVLSGHAGPGEPWTFGWSWGKDEAGSSLGVPFEHSSGDAVAIGVSGLHERGHHLIDPGSGNEAVSARSALVAHSSAADADALSTALFVAGWETGSRASSTAAALIDSEGVPSWNRAFSSLWSLPQNWMAVLAVALGLGLGAVPRAAFADSTTAPTASAAPAPLAAAETQPAAAPNSGSADDSGAVDLSALGDTADSFTPYSFERSPLWAALPLLSLALVLVHLRRYRATPRRKSPTLANTTPEGDPRSHVQIPTKA